MSGIALFAPFAAVGILALISIALTLRHALPAIAQLRTEIAECPANREYTFRISEVTSTWNDGTWSNNSTVVALPIRPRRQALLPSAGLRAAA
ncbi:MAG: hypothetical protein RLZZ427_1439 [Pseudomonadota bacterium]|jgi:hypothetical protein